MGEIGVSADVAGKLAAIESGLGVELSRDPHRATGVLLDICYTLTHKVALLEVEVKFLRDICDGSD